MRADDEDVYTQSDEDRREVALAKEDLERVMSEKWGRRFVYRELARTGLYRTSYVAGDPSGMAFNEGQRNVGLMLVADIHAACPEQYSRMLAENDGR